MNPSLALIATCAFGLEAIVKRELAKLGYDGQVVSPGRVRFAGDPSAICRANLWLRTADRILLQMAVFPAPDFDALFETTKAVAWDGWLPRDATFPVVGRSHKSRLSSVPACQRSVKRAVADSLQAAHKTSSLPETGPVYRIEVALLQDQATLTIDTTGPSLHKRGYRDRATKAPLKETLAAAMVLLSFWDPERPLIDPFCGSGTLPIEAAMIGRRLAPGRHREFAAQHWPNIAPSLWDAARAEADAVAQPDLPATLVGTDIDARALSLARHHAANAGVGGDVHFQQRPFHELSSKRPFGCLITNPPYGQRLGEQRELETLYKSLPAVLRKLPTWSHFILTAYPNFESTIERQADRRRKLYNGRIECTFYQFHGPKPGEAAAAAASKLPRPAASTANSIQPVFGGLPDKATEQMQLFHNRLVKRSRHLRRWPTKQGITCYRLYDRGIPEIPLVVDRYEDHLHIVEYQRPHERDLGQHAQWLELMATTAAAALGVDQRNVFLKQRGRQRGADQHERVADSRHEITVCEGGLKFIVNLSDYADTGLFLDHRVTRSMIRREAAGTTFLNLFGYTGAFTVYAASGGAVRTTTVDWSRNYLDWAERNMAANELSAKHHRFVRADVRQYVRDLPRHSAYDLAVIDPPTFSNSKRTSQDWDVQRHHAELLNEVLNRMKADGVIFFSTNFRRFTLAESEIHSSQIHEITRQTIPADFRNRRIHRCWRIAKAS